MPEQNQKVYERSKVAKSYTHNGSLFREEERLLAAVAEDVAGQPILDVGMGGGRTTPALLELSQDYIGCDYAEAMVTECRGRFPGVTFVHGDARSMPQFRDGQFKFILFSFNGIDYVSHEDRLKVLQELKRLLVPGGWLGFSTHNLDKPIRSAFHPGNVAWSLNPLALARSLKQYVLSWPNHLRNKKLTFAAETYSICNDNAHNYELLTYYITKANQVKQLESQGYEDIRVIARNGDWADTVTADTTSSWLYYLARKPLV
jgi:ubiquinone/menaquinone biosynthesis C-methylase UbiE